MGDNVPTKIAQAKYSDMVVAYSEDERPFDLVVCLVTAYSARVNTDESMVFEVPYIHCPELFAKHGLVVQTNEQKKSEVRMFLCVLAFSHASST